MNSLDLNKYENNILKLKGVPYLIKSLLAGIMRVVRLSSIQKNDHLQCIWNTAADVIGPTFLFFIWWVFEEAKKKRVKQIYFLSRDGQVLHKIAKIINDRFDYGIDCRYLYVSRKACYLPALDEIENFERDWIMATDSIRSLSIEAICERLEIRPSDIQNILNMYGFKNNEWSKDLSQKERNKLKECLTNDSFQKIIAERALLSFKNAAGYLEQEGIGNKEGAYIVDLGWHGRIQFALSKILDKAKKRPAGGLEGFYFGIVDYEKIYKNDKTLSFLPLKWPMRFNQYMMINYTIYEVFAAADHGMVIGFSEKDGVFSPVLNRQFNNDAIEWGVITQQEGIVKFADIFTKYCKPNMLKEKGVYSILESLLCDFIQNPSLEEVDVYGRYMHDAAITEKTLREVGPIITYKDIFSSITQFNKTPRGTFWLTASFVRSHMPILQKVWRLIRFFLYKLRIVMPI